MINVVLPAGDGQTIYVGGSFSNISGKSVQNLARIRVSDGSIVSSFSIGSITGVVKDLRLSGGRLWVAGGFTHVQGNRQLALATVNPATGKFDPYMRRSIAGVHNGGFTTVSKIDVNPQGTRLIAIGNFDALDGVKNHQLFMLSLAGATAQSADFQTNFYESTCSRSFDSYMRDLDFSPDGSFFVVSTTGAYGGSNSACDETARWETGETGTKLQPSWVDYTGGDTTYAVEITDSAVYVGGHQRWQNNAYAGDRPGPGAVSRPGIAALDPINGLPFRWNPTRTRGVGVFDLLTTAQGLWVASDTDRMGGWEYHGRIALMPAAGKEMPAIKTPTLPNDVYAADAGGLSVLSFRSGSVGAPQPAPSGGLNWDSVRGAFMVNGQLYTAWSDGSFTRRSFDATSYGASSPVNTADLLVTLSDWRNEAAMATGMFFDGGRLYFTLPNSSSLYYRYFTPESDVVGSKRFVASGNVDGVNFSQVRGMFNTGTELYWATFDGALHKTDWEEGALSGIPVPGTASVASGPGVDGINWASRALFLFQDPDGLGAAGSPGRAPVADFTRSCAELTCMFNGGASSDSDGAIASYAWEFGDGGTSNAKAPSHTFAGAGTYGVKLTVTDNDGATGTVTKQVAVSHSASNALLYVRASSTNGNRVNHSVTVPASVQVGDTLVLFWTANSSNIQVTAPSGWTQLEAVDGDGLTGRAWTKTATSADAGRTVTAVTSGYAKSDVTVAAYRSPSGSSVSASASQYVSGGETALTTPSVDVSQPGSWLISYWGAKSTDGSWSLPASQQERSRSVGSGGGRIDGLLADSDGPVASGSRGEVTAAVDDSASRAALYSIVIRTN